MTNKTLKAAMGLLVLSFLSACGTADAKTVNGWNPKEVKKVVENLKLSLVQMEGLEVKMEQSREDVATKILGVDGRRSANNELTMDGRILRNYKADAWDDVGYLRDHWKRLSSSEKDLAGQARIDLDI